MLGVIDVDSGAMSDVEMFDTPVDTSRDDEAASAQRRAERVAARLVLLGARGVDDDDAKALAHYARVLHARKSDCT
jgi:hypothetical protein